MRPTSYPCVGGRYLPVASKCRTSSAPARHDGGAQPRLQGTIGWAFLGEREAPGYRWPRDTAVTGRPGRCAPGPSVVSGARARRRPVRDRARGPRWRSRRAGTRCTGAPPRPRRSRRPRGPGRARARRKPRLGSCSHGIGPWPRQPAAAQGVEAAVVAGAGVGVRPRRARWSARASSASTAQASDDAGWAAAPARAAAPPASGVGGGVLGQVRRRDAEQVGAHGCLQVGAGGSRRE